MAKRKTINKNLVGSLTVAGMLLTVGVVFVASLSAREKDPALIAERARAQEQQGELQFAALLYQRAFNVNNEVEYLIEGSRVLYELGEIGQSLQFLMLAHAQDATDVPVLETLLARFWQLRAGSADWDGMLEYADKLLALEPEHELGLVAYAAARHQKYAEAPTAAARAEAQPAADLALQRCVERDALDPRVVEVRVKRLLFDARLRATDLAARGRAAEADPVTAAAIEEAAALVEESVAANPEDPEPVILLADLLLESRAFGRAEQVLAQAVQAHPDVARVHLARASVAASTARAALEAEDNAALQTALALAEAEIAETIRVEPALYPVYRVKSAVMELRARADGVWTKENAAPRRAILDMYAQALADTVGAKSVIAVMSRGERAALFGAVFDLTVAFYGDAPDAEQKALFLEYARRFRDSAANEFAETVLVPLMDGQLAYLQGDLKGAIQAYLAAEDKAAALSPAYLRIALARLAELYARVGENGSALRYNERLLQWYVDRSTAPPPELGLQRAGLLLDLNRAEEALDQLDLLKVELPEDRRLAQLMARALTSVGRPNEAEQWIARSGLEDVQADMLRASVAGVAENFVEAERLLTSVLERDPTQTRALTMYASVMDKLERRQEGHAFLEQLARSVEDPAVRRAIDAHLILLSAESPEQRDARMLELIATLPDPAERARETFAFHHTRQRWDAAAEALDELEQHKPDDLNVLQWQFELSLRRGDFERARRYVVRLSQANADRAGGATFRGQLALAQNDRATALNEFRAAEGELPSDPTIKTQIATVLLDMNEGDRAVAALEAALDADPAHFPANKLMYLVLESRGRSDEAVDYLAAARKANPNDPFIKDRAQILEDEENPEAGIARREKLRAQNPEDVGNLIQLSKLYARVNRLTDATAAIDAAQSAQPSERRIANWGKRLFSRLDQRAAGEQVIRRYQEALADPERVDGNILLAEFYEELRTPDPAAAEEQYRSGLAYVDEIGGQTQDPGMAQIVRVTRLRVMKAYAEFLERLERYDDATALYREVLPLLLPSEEIDRKNVAMKIIAAELRNRDLEAAQRHIDEFREQFPGEPMVVMPQAQLALLRGEPERARTLLTELIRIRPQGAWAYYQRGRVNRELKRYGEAREDLLKAKEINPGGFEYGHRIQLVHLYWDTKAWQLAEAELRELMAEQPLNNSFPLNLMRMLQFTGQKERSRSFVADMIARRPEIPFWHRQLALMLASDRNFSSALPSFARAYELSNRDPSVLGEWLACLNLADRPAEVLRMVGELPPERVTPAVIAQAALAEVKLDRVPAATERVGAAFVKAASTELDTVYYLVGQMGGVLGADRTRELLGSLAERPDLSNEARDRLRCGLARQLTLLGGPDNHRRSGEISDAILASGAAPPRVQIEARVLKALAATGLEDHAEARRQYEAILEREPRNPQALNNLAYLLADKMDEAAAAVPHAELVAEVAPDNANVLDTLGWVYLKAGRSDDADAAFRRAWELDPTNMPVIVHWGQLHEQAGRTDEARRLYQSAVDLAAGDASEYADQARAGLERLR